MNCLRVCSDWCSYIYNMIEHERGMHAYELVCVMSCLMHIVTW